MPRSGCGEGEAATLHRVLYSTRAGRNDPLNIKEDPSHLPGAWLRVFGGPRISTFLSFVPDTRLSNSSISLNTYSYFLYTDIGPWLEKSLAVMILEGFHEV